MSRCKTAADYRVQGDERVQMVCMLGKGVTPVMEKAKHILWENRNMVIIQAGLNDLLAQRGANVVKQMERGI